MFRRRSIAQRRSLGLILVLGLLLCASLGASATEYNVIWDDDGDMTGLLALMLFLAHQDFHVVGVTVSAGEAVPAPYATRLAVMLERLGYNIPIAYGSETPVLGDHVFPEPWRKGVTSFFNLDLCEAIDCTGALSSTLYPQPDAAELIAQALASMDAGTDDLVLFASGPLTNVYEALAAWANLDTQADIEDKATNCLHLEIMGGAVTVPGNLSDWPYWTPPNGTAEWNIWVDPHAAAGVFSGPAIVHVSPLDATNEVLWTSADVDTLKAIGTCFADFAATLLDICVSGSGGQTAHAWDLVAAAMTVIRLAEGGVISIGGSTWIQQIDDYCLYVDTFPPNEGWTRVCCGPTNAQVYRIDSQNAAQLVKEYVIQVFAQAAS